jgi:hypothetical protein
LADVGIDKKLSARSQKVGSIGEKAFEAVVANVRQRIADQDGRVSLDITAGDKKQRRTDREASLLHRRPRHKPQGCREGNLETFPAAAGGAAGCRGARSSNSFAHIMFCVRETAAEQKPRSLLSGSSQNQCMQDGPMQKCPR